jgi:hypothetical protein
MSRSPRLEYPGALYHVTARGVQQGAIFVDDRDRVSWLATAELHGVLMGQVPQDAVQTAAARRRYADWVDVGRGARLWKDSLRHGLYLGDEAFVERVKRDGA